MSTMTQALRKLHGMPHSVIGMARVRIIHHTRNEQPVPVAKARQWNELIPSSEVSKLRYVAELDGGSACPTRVVLP
jgi:hypothetical protein